MSHHTNIMYNPLQQNTVITHTIIFIINQISKTYSLIYRFPLRVISCKKQQRISTFLSIYLIYIFACLLLRMNEHVLAIFLHFQIFKYSALLQMKTFYQTMSSCYNRLCLSRCLFLLHVINNYDKNKRIKIIDALTCYHVKDNLLMLFQFLPSL